MNIQLLFFSGDPYFAELFSNYVGSAQHEFAITCFTDEKKAAAYWQAHRADIQAVLAPQAFLAACTGSAVCIVAADFTRCGASAEETHFLNVYQQRRDMLADLRLILNTHLGLNNGHRDHGHTKVLSFFSTQGGSGKSSLAYLTAVRAAQLGTTVYLSLEPAPAPQILYPVAPSAVSGEDLVYAVKDRQDPAKGILPALIHNPHNVYVLPTPHSLCDLMELADEDWTFLVEGLLQYAGADYLILDLGAAFTSTAYMAFDHSDVAALVYTDEPVGQAKRDQLLDDPNFNRLGIPCPVVEVRNKCHRKLTASKDLIPFPFSKTMAVGGAMDVVLSGNNDISGGCSQLLEAANRGV